MLGSFKLIPVQRQRKKNPQRIMNLSHACMYAYTYIGAYLCVYIYTSECTCSFVHTEYLYSERNDSEEPPTQKSGLLLQLAKAQFKWKVIQAGRHCNSGKSTWLHDSQTNPWHQYLTFVAYRDTRRTATSNTGRQRSHEQECAIISAGTNRANAIYHACMQKHGGIWKSARYDEQPIGEPNARKDSQGRSTSKAKQLLIMSIYNYIGYTYAL